MLETLAAPSVLPVSLAVAKSWLRETTTDWDADTLDLLNAAVERVETISHNAIVYRPVREQFDSFLPWMELAAYPPRGVKSITYLDPMTALPLTLDPTKYIVDVTKGQARITPQYSQYFPPARLVMNAVQITYDIGHLVPVTTVSGNTLTAPGHNKANGDVVQLSTDGDAATVLPTGLVAGTAYYAVNVAGDNLQLATTSGGAAIALSGSPAGNYFIGILPRAARLAMRLLMNTWANFSSDVTAAQVRELPVHGVEALLGPLKPRGF